MSTHPPASNLPVIPRCACCGNRQVLGVYVAGDGYCVPCERAIRNAPNVQLTPEAKAFVRRTVARGGAEVAER